MARSKTKSVADMATVETTAVADIETTDVHEETAEKAQQKKVAKKTVVVEPLDDSDEIEVVSLIPNVSYKDNKTGDMFEWDEVGHVEYMTFETLKNMWRSHKGYFRNMWIKPNDDRVINKFGLTKLYENYEFLMDESNYTKRNIVNICKTISSTPNGLKRSLITKVKDMVVSGVVTDVKVIRTMENHLKVDLISLL